MINPYFDFNQGLSKMLKGFAAIMALCVCMSLMSNALAAEDTYIVKSGETLDQVIRKTMGDSPLRMEVLRQAFMQQNPQAFTKSSPRILMAGAVITIPDGEVLLKLQTSGKQASKQEHAGADWSNERKNWVRFP
jgi:Tfp pilus assembly protein FimV